MSIIALSYLFLILYTGLKLGKEPFNPIETDTNSISARALTSMPRDVNKKLQTRFEA